MEAGFRTYFETQGFMDVVAVASRLVQYPRLRVCDMKGAKIRTCLCEVKYNPLAAEADLCVCFRCNFFVCTIVASYSFLIKKLRWLKGSVFYLELHHGGSWNFLISLGSSHRCAFPFMQ